MTVFLKIIFYNMASFQDFFARHNVFKDCFVLKINA